jgi:hypothetical protein
LNVRFTLEHRLIPDGTFSIVQLAIKCEFSVPSEGGTHLAEEVIFEVAARLTGRPLEQVREELATQSMQNLWMADIRRPEERSWG